MGLEPPLLSMKVFLSLDGPRHHFGSPVPHSACCYLQYILQLRRRGTGKFYHMNNVMGKTFAKGRNVCSGFRGMEEYKNVTLWHMSRGRMQQQCQYCHTTMPVISKKIGCVLFVSLACNCQGRLAHKSVLALVWISTDHVSNMEGIEGSPIWLVLPMFRWCPQNPVVMTRCSFHP